MACPESCFQAETAESCAAALREWTPQTFDMNRVSLHEAIQIFCSGTFQPDVRSGFASLGPLNLFVIISGIRFTLHLRRFDEQLVLTMH